MAHALNWFEIPVTDFARAQAFYETILGIAIARMEMAGTVMGMLSSDPAGVGGALVDDGRTRPSEHGTIVYLNGGDDLATILNRVAGAGGEVLVPKTEIGNGFGFFAHFRDTDGNRVGLHSMA